jgi:NAD(P)-dependent dehydrogenase (short-subunit alcohol dehydrogenase family)
MIITSRCKKVLITGGGSGIGYAIAKALLDEGCEVCIAGRNPEKLSRAKDTLNSGKASILQWDVTNVSVCREKINEACVLLGGYCDGVVNSAGVWTPQDMWNTSDELWRSIVDTNLKAVIFIMQQATIYMRDNHIKGSILNIASVAGSHGTGYGSVYPLSKDALVNATRYMAKQAYGVGVTINGIAPGITATEMSARRDISKKEAVIGRMIEAEEIARIAVFMLSDAAGICIGETLIADGGFLHAW